MKPILFLVLFYCVPSHAYQDSTFSIGFRPMMLGLMDRVTEEDSGKAATLGSFYWQPLHFAATFSAWDTWFINPYFNYSLIPNENSSGDIEEKIMVLGLPFGQNLTTGFSGQIDWNISTGIFFYQLEGSGKTYTDPNSAVFYYPGRDSESKILFIGSGIGYELPSWRFDLDLLIFSFLHEDRRTFNLAFTIAYRGIF
jgi:hypothetical protein